MIELTEVHKRFGRNEVLKGISIAVEKGEVVCIIGPSGSGKSTILRCINGLESYDRGDIRVEGLRVDRAAASIIAVRTQVSMVFQRFNLFPHRTALENVIEGPVFVKKEPRAQAIERGRTLLAQVGLVDKADAHPPQLFRWPAAARCDRPRARDAAEGDPVRRADLSAGSGTRRRGAVGNAQARR